MDIISGIFEAINTAKMLVCEVHANKSKSHRLVERLETLKPLLKKLDQEQQILNSAALLNTILTFVQEIGKFLEKFTESSTFMKVWNLTDDTEAFEKYNEV